MKILVTGAGGGLGGEAGVLLATGDELFLFLREHLDVTDIDSVHKAFQETRPDAVLHAAAYTQVDQAEKEPEVAEAVNVQGTRNVARVSADLGAKLVYPSTDYVFDGEKGSAYFEDDATNPLSVYGRTKLEGERAAQETNPKTFVVRTSWLYSPTGKSFVTTMLRLFAERDELTVVDDEISSPTYSADFTQAARRLLDTEEYGLYHASAGGETSWCGYAQEIARLAGSSVKITPTTATAYGLPATRPAYSKLDSSKLAALNITLPDWRDGLKRFFEHHG